MGVYRSTAEGGGDMTIYIFTTRDIDLDLADILFPWSTPLWAANNDRMIAR